jgi:hypothetical protein
MTSGAEGVKAHGRSPADRPGGPCQGGTPMATDGRNPTPGTREHFLHVTQLRRWGTIQEYVNLCRVQGYFTPAFYRKATAHMERIHQAMPAPTLAAVPWCVPARTAAPPPPGCTIAVRSIKRVAVRGCVVPGGVELGFRDGRLVHSGVRGRGPGGVAGPAARSAGTRRASRSRFA